MKRPVSFLFVILLLGILIYPPPITTLAAITASTYSAQYDRALDAVFLKKVEQAALTKAFLVLAEADTGVLWHQRKQLALAVLQSPTVMAASIAKGVTSNVAINDSSTDSDIQFTVDTQWNAFSYGR